MNGLDALIIVALVMALAAVIQIRRDKKRK
jgi:hypothetical protein